MKKPFLCRIGFHTDFRDTVLTNVGTKERPVLFPTETYIVCNYCGRRRLA